MYQAITSTQAAEIGQVNESKTVIAHTNIFTRFYYWAARQEERRFMWLAFAYILQIGLALPLTLVIVVTFGGNSQGLWLAACIVNVPSLALCLAAQPTKVILPVLLFAWIADAVIILFTLATFFMHS